MNPQADEHLTEGTKLKLIERFPEAIKQFEAAINLGLSHEEEMKARLFLGESYVRITNPNLDGEQMIESHEFTQALTEMESAVQMDAEGGYQYFIRYRSLLAALDVHYVLVGDFIQATQGDDAAVNYYVQKLNLFNYLPTQPLQTVLLQLGAIYGNRDQHENAQECFLAIQNAEPVMPEDESEIQVRQMAQDNLSRRKIEMPVKSGCFIATAVYGEAAPELDLFRIFRDEVLLKSIVGKVFVKFYYSFSPCAAKWLKKSKYAQQIVKTIVLKPILYFIRSEAKEVKSIPKITRR